MRRVFVVGVVVVLAVLAGGALAGEGDGSVEVDVEEDASFWLQPRGSILIDSHTGPTGFVLGHHPVSGEPIHNVAMGVRGGSGTVEDPFVISNWTVYHMADFAIQIQDTEAHVVVRNVTIPGEDHLASSAAVILEQASNVTFEDVWVRDKGLPVAGVPFSLPQAFVLEETRNVHVKNTWIGNASQLDTTTAIWQAFVVEDAIDTMLENVTITGPASQPLVVDSVDGFEVKRSTFFHLPGAFPAHSFIEEASNFTVRDSVFFGNTFDV